jgi:hypothetical protein
MIKKKPTDECYNSMFRNILHMHTIDEIGVVALIKRKGCVIVWKRGPKIAAREIIVEDEDE